ncbi:MAG: hypothetical protein ACK58T_39980, partial [Phycisphaerae bacterium]
DEASTTGLRHVIRAQRFRHVLIDAPGVEGCGSRRQLKNGEVKRQIPVDYRAGSDISIREFAQKLLISVLCVQDLAEFRNDKVGESSTCCCWI